MADPDADEAGPPSGVGSQVGRYRLERALGAGGMASVYLGAAPDGTVVAVKVMHPASLLPEDRRRFTREYDALARMDHPNIVRVFESGVADNYPWIAMEYVDGPDLETAIATLRDLPHEVRWARIEQVLRGLCAGLQYVHDLGLIHRDLKPTNVLLTKAWEPKISDFGVVKDGNAAHTALTKAGRLVGTVAFMAPEQITGEPADHRADLYALGAVLYVMLTGRRPIEAKSIAGYLARHLTEVPAAPGTLDPSVPPRLEKVCMRLLCKEPDRRYATTRALLQALDRPAGPGRLPLRGRDAVLAHWSRRLARLADGRSGVITVTGALGSGRTFLLDALADEATTHGVQVVRVRPHGDALTHLLRALGSQPDAAPAVLLVDDLDELPDGDPEVLARAVRDARAGDRAALLVVYTALGSHGRLADLATGATTGVPADQVLLEPLDRDAVTTMLRDRGITGPAAPVLGRRLHEAFDGLPGAIQQQLDTLTDAGWLRSDDDGLTVVVPIKQLRSATLPIPPALRARLLASLSELDALQRELVDVLALLERPASAGLLERCAAQAASAARALDGLVRRGVLRREAHEAQETLSFTHPCAGGVYRDAMPKDVAQRLHGTIARALSSHRRRDAATEIARHLLAAGAHAEAYPMFVRAARRAARTGLFLEVLQTCAQARSIRDTAEPALTPDDRVRARRWLAMLEGEAQLARGHWPEAVTPLEEAVEAARAEGDPAALARCLGSLGRAHYRQGDFLQAAPRLEEALRHGEPEAPERAAATRALADIRLREGRLDEARTLWQEALDLAHQMGSRDGEARARRGMAHVAALQGHLVVAADMLDGAEDLLKPSGDDRVRAGVMARALELDIVAGRFGSGAIRAEQLLELSRTRELAERLPEAFALHAEALAAVGHRDQAAEAARDALTYARAQGPTYWDARLRAARVLCALGDLPGALDALPEASHLPVQRVDDPPAQLAVLRARCVAAERPLDALDLAQWALVRPAPLLAFRAARIAADAARALHAAGDTEGARTAAKRGLRLLDGPGGDGLRLEILLAFHTASPDPRVLAAAGQLAGRLLEALPSALGATFRARPEIAAALAAR